MKTQSGLGKIVLALLAFALLATAAGCGSSSGGPTPTGQAASGEKLEGKITISGAFALYPMMQMWVEEFTKLHPDVKFDVSAGGAGKGMTDALSDAVDIGMVSRAISAEEEAKGAFWVACVKDAVFATINEKNPVLQDLQKTGIPKEIFEKIFITGEVTTWGQVVGRPEVTDPIHVFTRADACGAADVWAKFLGDMKQEDLLGIAVQADPGLLEAVVKDPLAIGYNNLNYAYDAETGQVVTGAQVVSIDKNGNGQVDPDELYTTKQAAIDAVGNGTYPSPPARDLNLVTNGKPSGLVQAFMEWVLTDGQQLVPQAGYIQLPTEQLDGELAKLK